VLFSATPKADEVSERIARTADPSFLKPCDDEVTESAHGPAPSGVAAIAENAKRRETRIPEKMANEIFNWAVINFCFKNLLQIRKILK
jgi:hypothetical protein